MNTAFWLACSTILVFLVCLDYFLLWKLSGRLARCEGQRRGRQGAGMAVLLARRRDRGSCLLPCSPRRAYRAMVAV